MSGSLLNVAAAAKVGSLFNTAKCRELDKIIREKNPTGFKKLSDSQFVALGYRLSSIASIHRTQAQIGKLGTPVERKDLFQDIERHSVALLSLFGVDQGTRLGGLPVEHVIEGGIFGDTDVGFEPLVSAVETIAALARNGVVKLDKAKPRKRSPDKNRHHLYNDLAVVYQTYWGDLRISVNGDKGGPAVRYLQFTHERILGNRVSARSVKDAIATMKRMHSEGLVHHSMFPDS